MSNIVTANSPYSITFCAERMDKAYVFPLIKGIYTDYFTLFTL